MTATVLFRIFTIEIGDTPTLTFEAQNQREAQELCHEQWLKDDLAKAKSDGVPLWDGKVKLRARMASPGSKGTRWAILRLQRFILELFTPLRSVVNRGF